MFFPPNWYYYDVSYAHLFCSIAAVLLTCAFLYISLAKNKCLSKGRYALCGGIAWIFLVLAALYFNSETTYAFVGTVGFLFLLSVLGYKFLNCRDMRPSCTLLAPLLALAQLAAAWLPVFLPSILQMHFDLQINQFFPERAVFYLLMALGILLLFVSYLPRRSNQWRDDAAVLLSALAFAAAVCGILFSFQNWYRGLLIWGFDLILCLLTLAAYVLLLMAGKKPDSDQSEPPADTEIE